MKLKAEKQPGKIRGTKYWLFGKMCKTGRSLVRLTEKKRTHKSPTSRGREDTATDAHTGEREQRNTISDFMPRKSTVR